MVLIMNNINLGVDIVLVDRINKILNSKKKSRFLSKIFSRSEISDSKNRQNQSEYFSGRFAAKEAIISGLDMTIDQGLKLEGDLNFILQTSADRSEGISSFINKTTPNYYGK